MSNECLSGETSNYYLFFVLPTLLLISPQTLCLLDYSAYLMTINLKLASYEIHKNDGICVSRVFCHISLKSFAQQVQLSTKNITVTTNTRVYPKVSRLATWSENCKWYSSLPLGAVVSLFCESV